VARSCTVCSHPERDAIDTALVSGESTGKLAGRYRTIDERAIRRHRSNHLSVKLAKAQEAEEIANADDLLAQVRSLHERTLAILEASESTGKLGTALGAIREARSNLELLAKLLGELNDSPTVNVLISPQWIEIRTVLLEVLTASPEARSAVAGQLLKLDKVPGQEAG
jgi:hypothetical protein